MTPFTIRLPYDHLYSSHSQNFAHKNLVARRLQTHTHTHNSCNTQSHTGWSIYTCTPKFFTFVPKLISCECCFYDDFDEATLQTHLIRINNYSSPSTQWECSAIKAWVRALYSLICVFKITKTVRHFYFKVHQQSYLNFLHNFNN